MTTMVIIFITKNILVTANIIILLLNQVHYKALN